MTLSGDRASCRWVSGAYWPSTLLLSFLLATNAASQDPSKHDRRAAGDGALTSGDVRRAVSLAGGYLERSCDSEGRFQYRVDLSSGLHDDSYNIVRHAGAMYALSLLNRSYPDGDAVSAMARAASYLRKNYIGQGPRSDLLVVRAKPLPQTSVADLGATGLGLVALAALEEVRPGSVPLQQLKGLGRFLLFMQRADGSFVSKYDIDGRPDEAFESLYYPGEAVLGLLYLYELDRSPIWLDAAEKALSYLARAGVGLSEAPLDHWGLIATAKFLSIYGLGLSSSSKATLVRHAVHICHALMEGQVGTPVNSAVGSFDLTGRTAPAATRVEGLLAALEFLPDNQFRQQVRDSVDQGVRFLLRAQIQHGRYAGGIPQASAPLTAEANNIRIDYVQHALCAWLAYASSRD